MADRYLIVHQGRIVMRRGLKRHEAEREAEMLATKALKRSDDHVEIKKDTGFERQDNEIYRTYRKGGS